ncbi:hypothetical protein [Arthrobacter sp. JCM 19049]|uniref:hypothetical protein n=1 Tax=Arthrobacter sp. JCM 19049 TaxID=1460643 RepID=UPI000B04AEB8|nr:hypothetical protein [Arthrobacter sp. JCM 19049]
MSEQEPAANDFAEQIDESVRRYAKVRPALQQVLDTMLGRIRNLFEASEEAQPLFITGRVKSVPSFRAKAPASCRRTPRATRCWSSPTRCVRSTTWSASASS